MKGKPRVPRYVSDSHKNQIVILRALCVHEHTIPKPRSLEISEIAEACGLNDEREIQRYLYILEGHKLVSPQPPGDFTSKIWGITDEGVRAFRSLQQEAIV